MNRRDLTPQEIYRLRLEHFIREVRFMDNFNGKAQALVQLKRMRETAEAWKEMQEMGMVDGSSKKEV